MFFQKKFKDETREEQLADVNKMSEIFSQQIISGEDCDQISGAKGEFGKNENNPIPVNGVVGEIKYLNRLRYNGIGFIFHRLRSIDKIHNGVVDVYEIVGVDGLYWGVLYFDMYHPRRSTLAPEGYSFADFHPMFSKIAMGFGVNEFDEEFPFGIPKKLVKEYGSFGQALAKKLSEDFLKGKKFNRPVAHQKIIDNIKEKNERKQKVEEAKEKKPEEFKVTPQQLGQLLLVFALDIANANLKNKEIIKNIGIEKIDQNHLSREMIIINMFSIVMRLQGLLKDKKLEYEILDLMHEAYYEWLIKRLNFGKEQIETERSHVMARYKEYQEATEEKKGPNWLWSVTSHMLNNLRKEKTKDAVAMMHLTTLFSGFMMSVSNLINEYELVKK